MKQLRNLLKDLLEDRVFQAEKVVRMKITMHIDPWCVGAGITKWREERIGDEVREEIGQWTNHEGP